jgi:membrane-associated phospholipid phosphatase
MATMRIGDRARPVLARLAERDAGEPGWALPRHPGDAVRLVAGLVVLAASTAMVKADRVGVLETNLFRLVNDLPAALFPAFWVVMQAGNLLVAMAAAAVAAATRRFWLAANLAAAAGGVWLLALAVKTMVGRGRPPDLLDEVNVHGAAADGLGYVSGHAAVAVAVATIVSPYLSRRWRRVAWTVAFLTGASRIYVGAHLPLDVVGGAALGWTAGALVHLLLGAPGGRPDAGTAAKALAGTGIEAVTVTPLGGRDARRAARFQAVTANDERLFVKLIPEERRDADLAYRVWRMLTRRRHGGEPGRSPTTDPADQQVEREAYLGLLAASAGVRTPQVVLAGRYRSGAGLLVQRFVPGRSLEERDPLELDDETLAATWREAARLHQAGIAHGDLGRHSVIVDDAGRTWLVDFDHASAAASERARQADLVELLVGLASRVGAERAVAGALAAVGAERLAGALAATRPAALTRGARAELRARPGLLDELARLADPGPAVQPQPEPG